MRGSPRSGGARASAGLDEAGLSVPAHLRAARTAPQGDTGIGRGRAERAAATPSRRPLGIGRAA